jgi:hypothetical protein
VRLQRRGHRRRDPRSRRSRWVVGIALFKLHPDLRAEGWNDEHAGLNACGGDARKSPAAGNFAENVGALHHDPADLEGVDVVDGQAAIFAIVASGAATCCGTLWAHTFTVGTVET